MYAIDGSHVVGRPLHGFVCVLFVLLVGVSVRSVFYLAVFDTLTVLVGLFVIFFHGEEACYIQSRNDLVLCLEATQ